MNPTRLLIIDDHDHVREALRDRLKILTDLDVVGCTRSWRIGLQRALELKPDVVLLETKRADGQGLVALQRITDRCSWAAVVVLTSYLDVDERDAARSQGASGYLLKDIDTHRLLSEIQSLAP